MSEQEQRQDSWRAAATLARSQRVRGILRTVFTLLILPAVTGIAGWIGSKLDTKLQVDALQREQSALSGQLQALQGRQADLEKAIVALTAPVTENFPGGPITQLSVEVRYAHRGVVKATVMALAGEREREKQIKRAAVKDAVGAFDRKIHDGDRPREAAESVFNEVAIP